MSRLWIGIGLMVVLLAMGIGLLWGSSVFFKEFSEQMEQAGDLAMAGNWAAAEKKVAQNRGKWEKWRFFWWSRCKVCFLSWKCTDSGSYRWILPQSAGIWRMWRRLLRNPTG